MKREPFGSGRRDALAWLCAASGLCAARSASAAAGRELRVLAYHRVLDTGPEERFPRDPELVSATVADFAWQMEQLRRSFRPTALSEVLRCAEEGRPLPPRAVVVTFDDGHGDNYLHAFPALRRFGIPATIFLSTAYVGSDEPFWFDDVAARIFASPRQRLRLSSLGLDLPLGDVAARRRAAGAVLAALKLVAEEGRLRALEELRRESAAPAAALAAEDRPLTWDQAREMQDAGVEFGSHTVSHPILSRIGEEQLRRELVQSRAAIEHQLGREVRVLAYPVGGEEAYDQRVVSTARGSGYRMGLTYIGGASRWPLQDPFAVRRLHVERYTTRARFHAMLAFPALFH